MELTITIRVDPRQIRSLPVDGTSNRSKCEQVWTSAVTKTIKEAGFDAVVEIGVGLDAYRDWHLTIGSRTIKARGPRIESPGYGELAATILGDCKCSGGPCSCSERGREVLAGLLPVIVRNAELAVERSLERGEYAIEDASRGLLPEADEDE